MSERLPRLDYATPPEPPARAAGEHLAVFMLLLATVAWGFGFTWAKAGGEAINRLMGLGDLHGAAIGPLLLLAVRFLVSGLLLLLVVPAARRGWSIASARRCVVLGGLVGFGMILQHLGLDRSSEAVTAFLTSLTILFVPILMTVALRRPPAPIFWVAVGVATLGVWLMTGAAPAGFGLGEAMGLGCAIVFSVYLILVNVIVPRDDPWRISAGQLIVGGALTLAVCPFVERGGEALAPSRLAWLLGHRDVWLNLALLVAFPTLYSYTAMNLYQPRLEPTHAALIYLMEPLFAAGYAYFASGRGLDAMGVTGALLILGANGMVEIIKARAPRPDRPDVN